uniref:Bm7255 n=1 Tax=Syphacia muris TaxID=451379 RepID=A0A0N5A8A0_9BILA
MSWIIRLQHLPLSANAADIRAFFVGLRIPDGAVHIVGGVDGDAFIGFATDEDARQAMTYDQRRIHDQRVRLLLSSRVEMETVIAKARAGELGGVENLPISPKGDDPQAVIVRQLASASSDYLQCGTQSAMPGSAEVFGLRNGSSRPGSELGHGADYHQQEYSRGRQASVVTSQHVIPWQDPKVLNVLSQTGSSQTSSSIPVYQQSSREERFGHFDQEPFQGYNASLQPPSAGNGFNQVYQSSAIVPSVLSNQTYQSAAAVVVPQVIANQIASSSSAVTSSSTSANAQNSYTPFSGHNAPIFPPVPVRRAEKPENYFVELSRLPTELLRPSALEQFLRPTVPLTLSSVKVVFDPKGFPLHSLVRFENAKDAESVLNRDGEQGIRIRECTKAMFDSAIDGSVLNLANNLAFKGNFKDNDLDHGRETSMRSMPGRTHYAMDRRDNGFRRDDRIRPSRDSEDRNLFRPPRRGRSRSPPQDYHELKRRREDGRYYIEFINLPFRVTESEIRQYFGPLCEPIRVSRAYYEDGKPSDRWVIEFGTKELADRAFHLKGKIQDRLLRARWLTEQEAEALLAIPDKFGMQRREEYEKKQAGESEGNYGHSRDTYFSKNHFNQAPARDSVGLLGGPPSAVVPHHLPSSGLPRPSFQGNHSSQSLPKPSGLLQRFPGPRHPRANGPLLQGTPRPPLIPPPTFFGAVPSSNIKQRGPPSQSLPLQPSLINGPRANNSFNGSARRPGNGPVNATQTNKSCVVLANVPDTATDAELAQFLHIHPSRISDKTRKRMLDGSVYIDLSSVEDASRAASRCNRQQLGNNCILVTAITHEKMMEGLEKKVAFSEQKEIEPDVIASVGPPGTVISCHGFPPDITLNDVMQFFDKYSLVENSVRIKLDDSGNPTGECLLAVGSPQEAAKAVMLLSGRRLNGSTVTMTVIKSPSA